MTTQADKVRLLIESDSFDEAWYVERYPDVQRSALPPAKHYKRIGQHLGRRPKPDVDANEASRVIAGFRASRPKDENIDAEERAKIASLRLFDPQWYRAHFAPDLPDGADSLTDYLRRCAGDPSIDPGPLFSTSYYAEKHSDTVNMPPLRHAAQFGIVEGRTVFDPRKVDTFLSACRNEPCDSFEKLLDASKPVRVHCWKDGNFFFSEIAHYLIVYLREKGFDVASELDSPHVGTGDGNTIVVAPHEFCVYGPGKSWSERQLSEAVYLNTEQWHTSWFSLSYQFLVKSNKAIDMNPASAAGLHKLGIQTAFLPLLPMAQTPFHIEQAPLSSEFAKARDIRELTYPDALLDRPYDVFFIGSSNTRREAVLGSLASVLAEHEAFLHCPRFEGPVRPGDPDMASTSDLVQIARNAKILLNIHQGESRYFEWHRLVLFGIMEGCVVLTEPCIPNAFVQADRDFLECPIRDMPERLRWLLDTAEGQAELRRVRANCDRLRQTGILVMEIKS